MKPDSIRKFDIFYLACVALGVASSLLNYEAQVASVGRLWQDAGIADAAGIFVFVSLGIAFVINLLLWFLVSRLRMGWVKWVLVVFVAYSAITMAAAASMGMGSVSITGVITTLLKAIAVFFLFQPDAKEWFATKGE